MMTNTSLLGAADTLEHLNIANLNLVIFEVTYELFVIDVNFIKISLFRMVS